MTDTEKLQEIKKAFDWCKNNTEECEDTKYEDDAVTDNFNRLNNCLKEIFKD